MTPLGTHIEPFNFDLESARYLLRMDEASARAKCAFRKNAKCELVTLHVLKDRLALQGQLNPYLVHQEFSTDKGFKTVNP